MNKPVPELNSRGEFVDPTLLNDIRETYKPDSPFLRGVVPYIIMLICGVIDVCFFYSLFSLISYDRPLLLWVQIAGFVFGFDCIPVFLGIHFKKLKQGLSKDTFTLKLALAVCALICAVNIGLRATTVELMSPDLSSEGQSYFGQTAEEPVEEENAPDPVAWMIAITGMVVPIVTSVGSFYISNHCFDPLLIRKQREEKMIARKADKIRRLSTLLLAYDEDRNLEARLLEDDERRYAAARAMTEGLLLEYHSYVRQRMMESLQDPASTSMLSLPSDGEALIQNLHQLYTHTVQHTNLPASAQKAGT